AECLLECGERDGAVAAAFEVLTRQPQHAGALHLLGRVELERGRTSQAADYLRRAVEQAPFERAVLYDWLRCLRLVGTPQEVEACQKRLQQCEADLDRVVALTREVAARPADPELRYQLGEIQLRNGQDREGIRWLHSALAAQPGHAATHRLLAQTYERKGQPDL